MNDDIVSVAKLTFVCPDIAQRWLLVRKAMWDAHQLQIRVTDGYRNFADQWNLFCLGRKKNQRGEWIIENPKKVVTYARGGESFHNFGLAIDSAFMGDDPYLIKLPKKDCEFLWSEFGRICKENDLEWGGDWPGPKRDRPHCQRSYDLSLSAFQMIYEEHGIRGIFEKCSQIMECGRETI